MEFMEYHQSHLGTISMQVELFWINQNTPSASGGRVSEYVAMQSATRNTSFSFSDESSNTQHLSLLDGNSNLKPVLCIVRKQEAAEREQTRKTRRQIATLHISLPSPSGIWLKMRAKNVHVSNQICHPTHIFWPLPLALSSKGKLLMCRPLSDSVMRVPWVFRSIDRTQRAYMHQEAN